MTAQGANHAEKSVIVLGRQFEEKWAQEQCDDFFLLAALFDR